MASILRSSVVVRVVMVAALAVAMLATTMAGVASASENVRVDMRVLLMAADDEEEDLKAWQAVLDRAGMPYDVFITTVEPPITDDVLSGGADHARYQAVVLSSGNLDNEFAAEEWAVLDDYQIRFGIRRISGNTYPIPEKHGLNYASTGGDISGDETTLTAAGLARFPSLAGPVDIGIGTYGYHATPYPGADFTTLLTDDATGSAMLGIHVRSDGLEQIVIPMAMGPSSLHTFVLGHGLLKWVTRGVYLGFDRNYFTFDIDDVFLPDDRWDVDDNVTYEDDCVINTCIRMVPSDVTKAVNWQNSTGLTFKMVFNSGGSRDAIDEFGSDPLTVALVAARYDFWWINHQWSHEEFDALTQKQMIEEIELNLNWATAHDIPLNPTELVTGSHSGLHSDEIVGAFATTGIEWVAADNSREPTPYQIGDATTLPRHPSNVYYNVGTKAEQLDEYNWIFYENCVSTPTTTCFTEPATWATYVDNEVDIMLPHILGNDPRPHYFHQSNLAEERTFYEVVDELLARYNRYMAIPIVQPNYRAAVEAIQRGDDWAAKSGATDAYIQNGRIYLTSPTATQAPMTGIAEGELYGGERSMWVTLRSGTTRVIDTGGPAWPMPAPLGAITAE